MTSKQRMMLALQGEAPDRLPATVHQWQRYHLETYLDGIDALTAFRQYGLDAAITSHPLIERETPQWRKETRAARTADGHPADHVTIHTPEGELHYVVEHHPMTDWMTEYPVKRPEDIELLDRYMPVPGLDRAALLRDYDALGDDGIMRGFLCGYQGGCWQDAAAMFGLEALILATYSDPDWVHRFLEVLQNKKLRYIREELHGARYDLIETGGGAASTTCISPKLHREYCLPYDREQHEVLHEMGFPVVYHTCGGMMPILETIVENGCDASETLTPPAMGGDADHAEIKRRIGGRVCLIGGLDQLHVLDIGSREEIRREVFRLFETLGAGGGYMLSPSDHFFDTPPEQLEHYAAAARECRYA